jgi:hypothetical protein
VTPRPGTNEDFRDLLAAMVEEGVEFVIVGAYTLALHGVPRYTRRRRAPEALTIAGADRGDTRVRAGMMGRGSS